MWLTPPYPGMLTSGPEGQMKVRGREPSIEAKFAAKRRAWARNPSILRTTHRVYQGDARLMEDLGSDQAIHLVVTSPPYWNLKEY
jgi:hypothetical protein